MHEDHRPFGTYLLLSAAFNAGAVAVGALLGDRRRVPLADLLVLGTATHEISRIVSKERVTRTIRKPFVEVMPDGHEEPFDHGPRRALGELLTCPYCIAPWIALALGTAYRLAPSATRTYASVMSIAAVSDFLHRGRALMLAKRRELSRRAELAERLPPAPIH
ncbi:MAG TPA: DUF1360 domain-containing protein [Sandaracinaceae bacterium]